MKRAFALLGMLAIIASVAVAMPQRGGNRDVGRQLPLEGAPLAVPGPYEVVSGPAFGSPGHVVFRPADLSAFPTRDSLPVMAWGNGGCSINNPRYSGFLETVASHGFLVLMTTAAEGSESRRATVDDMRAALDWAEAENDRAGSPLQGKIATDRMSVMGQSCGGGLSISMGSDPRVDTIGPFNIGVNDTSELDAIHGPILLINGGEVDFMYEPAAATYDAINHVPVFYGARDNAYGARDNAGHTATMYHPGGGEFANVASNWLRWTLKGDQEAGRMFAGADCTLCTNPTWETRSKGWD